MLFWFGFSSTLAAISAADKNRGKYPQSSASHGAYRHVQGPAWGRRPVIWTSYIYATKFYSDPYLSERFQLFINLKTKLLSLRQSELRFIFELLLVVYYLMFGYFIDIFTQF